MISMAPPSAAQARMTTTSANAPLRSVTRSAKNASTTYAAKCPALS